MTKTKIFNDEIFLYLNFFLILLTIFLPSNSFFYKGIIYFFFFYNALNFNCINFKKKIITRNIFKRKFLYLIFAIFLFFLLFKFLKSYYHFQVVLTVILLGVTLKNVSETKFEKKREFIFFLCFFSFIFYFFFSFILSSFFIINFTGLLDYNGLQHLDKIFGKHLNHHYISFLFLSIFIIKIAFFRNLLEYKIFIIFSLLIDFFLFLSGQYYTTLLFLPVIIVCFLIFKNINFIYMFILIFLFSINYLFFYDNFIIDLFYNLIQLSKNEALIFHIDKLYSFINHTESFKEFLLNNFGNNFLFLEGILNRMFYYWRVDLNFNLFSIDQYNFWLFHNIFLEFFFNFGLLGLVSLYLYFFWLLYKFNSNKILLIYFSTILLLNTMDSFIFSHHYAMSMMVWFFLGIFYENKK